MASPPRATWPGSGEESEANVLDYDLSDRGALGLYESLCRHVRDDIVRGVLAPGEKLPSKRQLAAQLGVSLITVETALGQLVAEGYLVARPRRGYYVARIGRLPEPAARPVPASRQPRQAGRPLVADASRLPVQPDPGALALWEKSLRAVLSSEHLEEAFAALTPQGLPRLQADIAHLLAHTRGMVVDPSQVIVAAGAQVLYQLVSQLLPRNASFAVEDPGFPRIARTYESEGRSCASVAIDAEGMSMRQLRESGASLAHVMPSHQFPTGRVMSVARRYELLGWASERPGRLVVEDDYDCEFRLAGRPIPALASIDATGRVIYLGTFSKGLGPVVRAAYAVLPPALVERYEGLSSAAAGTMGLIDQLALTRMLEGGGYEGHVARYRRQVRARRDRLCRELAATLGDVVGFEEADSGLHLVLALRLGAGWAGREAEAEEALARTAREKGVGLAPLSSFARLPYAGAGSRRARFVLQYERLEDAQQDVLVACLGRLVEEVGIAR